MIDNLGNTLDIAGSGLAAVGAQLALVSHNIANASTPGYVLEQLGQQALTVAGQGDGVVTGVATSSVDAQLQQDVLTQNATVGALSTTQTALQSIDAAQGTVADGNDLASSVATLNSAFTALSSDPSSQVQQAEVVSDAATLAGRINTLGNTYTGTRQSAQDALVADIGSLDTTLASIGTLSNQIIAGRERGQSTADLEGQRNAALQTVSGLLGIKTLKQPNGDLVITTTGGLTLPIHGGGALTIGNAVIGPNNAVQLGDVPSVTLDGQDVTTKLTGGSIGANVTLRDVTLPTYQAQLDEFAQTLTTRFSGQGLALFTQPSGTVPAATGTPTQAGYVGYSLSIGVNPAVQSNASLVRDGTNAVAGSVNGPSSFTPNTDSAQTSYATLINRVLDYSFGTQTQAGVAQTPLAQVGLGPAGVLATGTGSTTALSDAAAVLVGSQSQDNADTTSSLANEQAVQTTLAAKFSATSAVDTDTELALMVKLQASYGANAKIFTAVQSMFSQLLASVT